MFKLDVDLTPNIETVSQEIIKFTTVSESQLRRIAEAIKKGIEYNILQGLEYTGNPVKPLAPRTVKKKKSSRPLFQTGLLSRSVISKKEAKDTYNIFISGNRSTIAVWLQEGTKRMPSRPFFGISKNVDSEIDKILTEEVKA
jgi:phage gpG-like protein